MPEGEDLARFAPGDATLAIHLSIHIIDEVAQTLIPHYGADGPVAVVVRASWPEERILRGTLAIVLASPKLLELDAKTVEHLRLVNTWAWLSAEAGEGMGDER